MPNRNQLNGITLVVVVLLGSSACIGEENRAASDGSPPGAVAVPAVAPGAVPAVAPGADPAVAPGADPSSSTSPGPELCPSDAAPFAASSFPQTPRVDNPYSPLTPGTRLTLEGRADRGGGRRPHQEVLIVTDLVKVINGVANVVVLGIDIQDGEVAKAQLAFFAQDTAGNVWNLGEYPEEWEDGRFVRAPDVWFSGIGDGRAGVHTKASPQSAVTWYLQGSAPSIDVLDCGRVSMTDAQVCVPVRCFTDVVVTEESRPLDPTSGIQLKYSARGVGIIQVGARRGQEGESMQLIERRTLNATELAAARASALLLEKRAYQTSPIYKQTNLIEQGRQVSRGATLGARDRQHQLTPDPIATANSRRRPAAPCLSEMCMARR